MSNKIQLQINNTSLEALITRVNTAKDVAASLPEADNIEDLNSVITELENKVTTLNAALDSKAAEKGTQIAIGTVVSDGVMLNVDDLPFTPQYVAVFPCANELHKMGLLGSSEIGVFNGVNYSSESEISGGTGGTSCNIGLSNIEITDNGFSVMPVEVDLADEYRYIAIG